MSTSVWLIPLSGPSMDAVELSPKAEGIVLGRQETCDIRMPADADKVSRQHVKFMFDNGAWRIADMNSRWGTFLNGVKLIEGRELPVAEGDLIRVTPWTFSFSHSPPRQRRQLHSHDDLAAMHTMVRSVRPEQAQNLAQDLLTLLLECAAGIHAAPDEKTLAEVLLDSACRGSGLANAALLRPTDTAGGIEIIASKTDSAEGGAVYSRALIAQASDGYVAELTDAEASESIIQNRINAAICVPITLGGAVAAYLYLDSRSQTRVLPARPLRPNAAAFCLALGRMASLALSNLKRIDIERRQAMLEAELSAAGEAQRWILPTRTSRFGALEYLGESRPGRHVGGDFFDVIPLTDGKLAVALGDVTGKGLVASVLMTAAQGFLHAALGQQVGVDHAVSELNRFIIPRRPEGKFITLWVGVLDLAAGTLSFVDAGHGYALISRDGGPFELLEGAGGVPVGVAEDWNYVSESVLFPHGTRLMIVSDGIIEQFGAGDAARQQFQVEGVQNCLKTPAGKDEVSSLFDAVIAHAGTNKLADDATILLVRSASTP